MIEAWTVKDSEGHVLPGLIGASRIDVGRKVVPVHYDAFHLHVSSSYRELFEPRFGEGHGGQGLANDALQDQGP